MVEFCTSHQLSPRELQYYDAESMYAWEGVYVNAYELEDEYGELDEEVQALIDEFEQKLRAIKRPIGVLDAQYSDQSFCVPVGRMVCESEG